MRQFNDYPQYNLGQLMKCCTYHCGKGSREDSDQSSGSGKVLVHAYKNYHDGSLVDLFLAITYNVFYIKC